MSNSISKSRMVEQLENIVLLVAVAWSLVPAAIGLLRTVACVLLVVVEARSTELGMLAVVVVVAKEHTMSKQVGFVLEGQGVLVEQEAQDCTLLTA